MVIRHKRHYELTNIVIQINTEVLIHIIYKDVITLCITVSLYLLSILSVLDDSIDHYTEIRQKAQNHKELKINSTIVSIFVFTLSNFEDQSVSLISTYENGHVVCETSMSKYEFEVDSTYLGLESSSK